MQHKIGVMEVSTNSAMPSRGSTTIFNSSLDPTTTWAQAIQKSKHVASGASLAEQPLNSEPETSKTSS